MCVCRYMYTGRRYQRQRLPHKSHSSIYDTCMCVCVCVCEYTYTGRRYQRQWLPRRVTPQRQWLPRRVTPRYMIRIYTYIHTCLHTYIHTYLNINTHRDSLIYKLSRTYTYTRTRTYIYTHIHTYAEGGNHARHCLP